MYAGLYRNQHKNGRIRHKIVKTGRIAIIRVEYTDRADVNLIEGNWPLPITESMLNLAAGRAAILFQPTHHNANPL
jgi:hypothetical protein